MTLNELFLLNRFRPTPRQAEAFRATERYILFGGGFGGGKSTWLANEAILHCLSGPGRCAVLCRMEKTALLRTLGQTVERWLPADRVKRRTREEIEFDNRSKIFFMGAGNDKRSRDRLRGIEASFIGLDQAEEISYETFMLLCSRLRLGSAQRFCLTANPSLSFVKSEFITSRQPNHRYIQSLASDNVHLDPAYVATMRETLPSTLFEIWMNGSWEALQREESLFPDDLVSAAMNRRCDRTGPVSYGVDVARRGTCKTIVARKTGNLFELVGEMSGDLMDQALRIGKIVKDRSLPINVDAGGVGGGLVDALALAGYNVHEIIGSAAPSSARYRNRRAENYWNFRSMLYGAQIPNQADLKAEMQLKYQVISDRLQVESKDDLVKRGQSSDLIDALVLAAIDTPRNITWAFSKTSGPDLRSNEEIMSEFMSEMKCNRIIRRQNV
jgi:hypothetical protein